MFWAMVLQRKDRERPSLPGTYIIIEQTHTHYMVNFNPSQFNSVWADRAREQKNREDSKNPIISYRNGLSEGVID